MQGKGCGQLSVADRRMALLANSGTYLITLSSDQPDFCFSPKLDQTEAPRGDKQQASKLDHGNKWPLRGWTSRTARAFGVGTQSTQGAFIGCIHPQAIETCAHHRVHDIVPGVQNSVAPASPTPVSTTQRRDPLTPVLSHQETELKAI